MCRKKITSMYFYIKQGSVLPILRLELIEDGRHDYNKFFEMLQAATITFTMINQETGITKIAKAPAYIKKRETNGCSDQYVICYNWKKRDTNESGYFKGIMELTFSDIIKNDNYSYPSGNLLAPIREELDIVILP